MHVEDDPPCHFSGSLIKVTWYMPSEKLLEGTRVYTVFIASSWKCMHDHALRSFMACTCMYISVCVSLYRWANQLTNTKCDYERSVLRQITGHHLHTLIAEQPLSVDTALHDPKQPSEKVAAAMCDAIGMPVHLKVSSSARVNAHETIHVSDFVLICMHVAASIFGFVDFLFDELQPRAVVRQFEIVHTRTRSWALRKTDVLLLVPVACIECSLWWCGDANSVRAIKPDFMQTRTG